MGALLGKITVETPKYEVLVKKDTYELRKYPALVAVGTPTDHIVQGNASFSRLARFIGVFGRPQNSKGQAIAMTAPVLTGYRSPLSADPSSAGPDEGAPRMMFLLPSAHKSTKETPEPTDPLVQVEKMELGTVGCVTFSGWATEANLKEREKLLIAALEEDLHKIQSRGILAKFNPWYTLGPWRKNELLIQVEPAAW
eukprot:CAMPEP_0196570756 /NCGR_PEP_ID=MMETSP1081-20130531/924_1 /TAXON_ID=36882 /ORGANISM="Pyramimonas amylifera, Strain CCMP720" /LENGTH=196 /DNA_ID=CAMNT_0041887379 /DNA_START=177 /DNA_END=764 /DNA_ORIENTATION=-